MSHYEIKYEGPEGEKQVKAMQDLTDWLGKAKIQMLAEEFRKTPDLSPQQFRFWLSFAGVSGYPVEAFFKTIWPERAAEWTWEEEEW